MKEETKSVLYSSPEAAQLKTVTGWVSGNGRFYGNDEHMARYDGCTHVTCECGNTMERGWLKCASCREKEEIKRYNALPFKEWDGKEPVYSYAADEYFFSQEDIDYYLEENNSKAEDLRLVLCSPNYFHTISPAQWEDVLPEDGDLPKELTEALVALNAVIESCAPASYSPGKTRTEYKPTQNQ